MKAIEDCKSFGTNLNFG